MPWPEDLTAQQRADRAAGAIERMLDNMLALLAIHEANAIICFSDTLTKQIPVSRAGTAYRSFATAMLTSEISRVCTFWDTAKRDRNSLPTVVALINDVDVQAELRRRLVTASSDVVISAYGDRELYAMMKLEVEQKAKAYADERLAEVGHAIAETQRVIDSDVYKAARDLRDGSLAHSLTDDAKRSPDLSAKYGDEQKLLEDTVPILELFNYAVRGSSFDWNESRKISRRNAAALWNGCHFKVIE